MSFSDTIVVADGQPGGRLYVAKRPGGTFEDIPKQDGWNWDGHAIAGTHGLATASDDLGDPYVRHPDASVVLLKDDPTRSVGRIAADTNFMAWQEGSGGTVWTGFTGVEVWAAPLTNDPSSLHPSQAADIPKNGLHQSSFGEGWQLVPLEAGGVRFVHLADAQYVDIAPPPGLEFIRAVNVAAGEAWFLMRTSPGIKNPVTVARYDLSAMLSNLP